MQTSAATRASEQVAAAHLLPPALSLFGERDVHVAHDHAPPRLNLHLLVLFRAFQDVRKRPPPPPARAECER
eukprot:3109222-Rhodomonas_salina.1